MEALRQSGRTAVTLSRPSPALARWAWPATALLILMVLLAPFFVVDVPAALDYPNHLARFYILAHPNDPVLSRIYAAHWSPLPNIGVDLIGAALLRVLPVHVAGRILLALSLVSPLAGTVVYARAAFGRWTWCSLGAGVVAFNGAFFFGSMNFLFSLGVALAGAAAWRVLRRRRDPAPAALAGVVIGLVAYLCHLLGFAFFALLIVAQEAEALLALRGDGRLRRDHVIRTAVILAAALGPSVALYVFTHRSLQRGDLVFWDWPRKLVEWAKPFVIYDFWLTCLTAAVLLVVGAEVRRRAQRASGVGLTLATLAVLFVVAPYAVGGGADLESRFPVMAAFLVFGGLDPQLSLRQARAVAAALVALGVGRSADVAFNWRGHAGDLGELRAALASVGPGSKVLLALTGFQDQLREGRGRVLQGVSRVDEHMAALVALERHAFWPLLFADPGQQPVVVLPPYDQISSGALSNAPVWQDLAGAPSKAFRLHFPYMTDWRRRFDYVLVLGPPPPPENPPSALSLVRAGSEASLYRIEH